MPKVSKKKKKEEGKKRGAKLLPSLALSAYGCVGLALLLVVSGSFAENVEALSRHLLLGPPFVALSGAWLFLGVFLSTGLVEPSSAPRVLAESLFSIDSFVAVLVSAMLCMYRVLGFVSWVWLITIIVLAGLCAIVHGWFLYFERTRNLINLELTKRKEDEIYVKSLEMEHGFFQSYFQQFISAAAIIFTAAVIGYYLEAAQVSALSLINASIMTTWLLVGFFFGIFIPIQKHMEYLRHVVRKIALKE